MLTAVPCFEAVWLLRILICPWYFSASCLTTQRPRPVPVSRFVVKNGRNARLSSLELNPLPLSNTVILTPGRGPFLQSREGEIRRLILPSSRTASSAFDIRFDNIWRTSPSFPHIVACWLILAANLTPFSCSLGSYKNARSLDMRPKLTAEYESPPL